MPFRFAMRRVKNRPRQHLIVSRVHNRFVHVGYLIFRPVDARNILWSNAIISLASSACVLASFQLAHVKFSIELGGAFALGIGSATWLAYTWQRHVKSTRVGGLRPAHQIWHQKRRPSLKAWALFLIPLATMPAIMTSQVFPLPTGPSPLAILALLLIATSITALYAGLPGERGQRHALRRIPGAKMIWIAGSWVTITALWPIWWSTAGASALPPETLFICGERFFVIAALTLPFDLRDTKWDPEGMRTWAQVLGDHGTRWLALALVTLAIAFRLYILPAPAWGPLVGLLAMGPAVLMARRDRPETYYGLLDALLIFDALGLLLFLD